MNEIVKINPETMAATVQSLPEVTAWIQRNHDKGLSKGQELLDMVLPLGQINPEIDQQLKDYIELAKKCKAMMYDKRSPITQLMDSYRKVFTSLEADFDVTSKESIPGQLQAIRNKYAAECERKRQEETKKAQQEGMLTQIVEKYKKDILVEYIAREVKIENRAMELIRNAYLNISLDNCKDVEDYIKNFKELLTLEDMVGKLVMETAVPRPAGLPDDYNLTEVRMKLYNSKFDDVTKGYTERIRKTKQQYLDMIPSIVAQLSAAKSQDDKEKLMDEVKRKEQEEALKMQQERNEAEAKAKQEAELKAQQNVAMTLFSGMDTQTTPNVKTKTKKVLKVTSKNAYLSLLNFWWINEGQMMDIEELNKVFKKMVTFAEKKANAKDPEFVDGEGISFEDEITAK